MIERPECALECLLFVAAEPLPEERVAELLHLDPSAVPAVIQELQDALAGRGLQVVRLAGGYQMTTRPEYAEVVQRYREPRLVPLSKQALETLAIAAYRQPITRPEIDAVRGVNSSHAVQTLAERGLITAVGRKEAAGRPLLYATTPYFLTAFGLGDLGELPQLAALRGPARPEQSAMPLTDSTDPTETTPGTPDAAAAEADAAEQE